MIGELVEISTATCHTPDGLMTTWATPEGIKLSERISLVNYPSFHDFEGDDIFCKSGQVATIVKSVGRPRSITFHEHNWHYDVYEILVEGQVGQIFANNLIKIAQNQRPSAVK